MKSHASMNRIYRLVWNVALGLWVAVAENAKGRSKAGSVRSSVLFCPAPGGGSEGSGFTLKPACRAALVLLAALGLCAPQAQAANAADATVSLGSGNVSTAGNTTTITQGSQRLAIDWTSLSTRANEALVFAQPNAQAIALNRITGPSPSELLGSLTANGQVFILNPNGVLFGAGSQVNVGGLVASTLNMSNADFMAGNHVFTGSGGSGSVVNQGTLNAAPGGYLALLAPEVRNEGVMTASLGTALLAAGNKVTLNLDNGSLLGYSIDQGAINALAENRQLIRADGGQVLLGAKALDSLTSAAVNNTGIIEARTIAGKAGRILLMGDMETGTVHVGGTLDASAPNGGDGGFIETSAAHVKVAPGTRITTQAPQGKTGKWLIDPQDYTIAASGGDITGADLSAQLTTTDVEIQSVNGAQSGNGDIHVNDAVSWSANKLTLTAQRDINVNTVMTATGSASLAVNTGAGGNLNMKMDAAGNFTGRVDLDTTGTLHINGEQYTITSVGDKESTTGTDLSGMRANLNGRYVLGKDVNFDDVTPVDPWGWDNMEWISGSAYSRGMFAIGSQATPFTGKFEGLGHTILNPKVGTQLLPGTPNGVPVTASTEGVGIFGVTGAGAVVSNIAVATVGSPYPDVVVNSYAVQTDTPLANYSAEYTGGIGALVGENGGLIRNASVNLALGVSNYVGASGGAGAVAGANNGTITGSRASVVSQDRQIFFGGLVGRNRGLIDDSHATLTGGIPMHIGVGGLVGWNEPGATIQNSSSSGVFAGIQEIGGLVGRNGGAILDSSSSATVTGQIAGGLVGRLYDGSISRSHASGDVFDNSFARQTVHRYVAGIGMVREYSAFAGVGGLVGNMSAELDFVSPRAGRGSIADSYATGNVWWTSSSDNTGGAGGLLGTEISSNYGSIVRSYATGNVTLGYHGGAAGGFAGRANLLTLDRNYATGNVSGPIDRDFGLEYCLGGFVGTGGIITNAYSTGNVTGNGTIGGFAGAVVWAENAYATGNVTSGSLPITGFSGVYVAGGFAGRVVSAVNTYSTGTVSGGGRRNDSKGAWAGDPCMDIAVCTNTGNYYSLAANPVLGDRAATGLTGTQLQQASSFAGFDLASTGGSSAVWRIYEGQTTPLLTAFLKPLTVTADNVTKVYDATSADLTNVAYSDAAAASSGQVLGLANPYGNVTKNNVGSYSAGLYSTQQGYDITMAGGNLTVTPATLTVSGVTADNKVYDGSTAATLQAAGAGVSGVLAGDTVSFDASGLSGAFSDKNVGTGKTVALTGGGISGTDAGNYTLAYSTPLTANIDRRALTVSATGVDKVYDRSTGATVTLGDDRVASDVLTLGYGAAQFGDRNAGTNKAVSVGGIAVSGADAGNYTFNTSAATTASITPASLTVSGITAADKSYNASDVATVNTAGASYSGLLAGDVVTVAATGLFSDKNVGAGKTVSLSSSYSGADVGNYAITHQASTTASITQANLTLTTTNVTKTYDGTLAASGTAAVASGTVFSGDSLSGGSFAFTDKNAGSGNKTVTAAGVTVNDGNGGNNYNVSYVDNTSSTINRANLTVTAAGVTKTYDGTTSATGTGMVAALAGAAAGEVVDAVGSQAFLDKNFGIGNKAVRASGVTIKDNGNADVTGNYNIAYVDNTTSTINRADLTVTATGVTKTYDGTLSATGTGTVAALAGAGAGELVNAAGSQAFLDKNAGTGNKTVRASGVTIKDAGNADVTGNYNIAYVDDATSTINKADLTVTATGVNKVYDGTTAATVGYGDNRVAGDVLGITGSATFADKNAGTGKAVGVSGIALAGTDAGNYNLLNTTTTTTASITPKALAVTANDDSRLAGGAPYAGGNGVSYSGFVGGDTVADVGGTLAYGGSSQGAVAAGNYLITPGGLNSISGNYALGFVDGALSIVAPNAGVVIPGGTAASGGSPMSDAYVSSMVYVAGAGAGGNAGGRGAAADALAAAAAEAGKTGEE